MAKDFTFRIGRFAGLNGAHTEDADLTPGTSPDMLNFKVTPEGALVKRSGCRMILEGTAPLRGMWCGTLGTARCYAAVFGDTLYLSDTGFDNGTPVSGAVPGTGKVQLFPFMGKLYLLTGAGIRRCEEGALAEIEPYVPMLTVATAPNGDGTPLDEINALTPRVRQSFVPDGRSRRYRLATRDVDRVDRVVRDGEDIPDNTWYWDDLTRTLTFLNAPEAGISEIIVHYRLADYDESIPGKIAACRNAVAFGGANDTRVFLYGCPDAPAARFHSGMADGVPDMGYFPVLNYTVIGDGSPVTGILRHYDRQLIFTEKAAYYSYLDYETETDGRSRAIFPVLPLSDDRGNLAPGQPLLVQNEPVTVTEAGLFRWVSTNVRDERNARLFSQPVREILAETDPRQTLLFNRKSQNELFILCGEEILVFHYGTGQFYRHRIVDTEIRYLAEMGDTLYFGTDSAICQVGGGTDLGENIPAYWTSPFLTLGARDREKNLYTAAVCLDTTGGVGAFGFDLLTPEGEIPVRHTVLFPAGSRARVLSFPARHSHFERVQLCLTAEGACGLHVRFLALRGRVCDKKV